MKRTIDIIIAAVVVCAGLGSCVKSESAPTSGIQSYEQDFTGVTRFKGDATPEHADTYRIIAFNKTGVNKQSVGSGSYAYDLNGDYTSVLSGGTVGSIVPVAINPVLTSLGDGYYSGTYKTTLSNGQLVKNGVNGMHLNTGLYYISMIHPAVPMYTATGLGSLAVFERADKIYASHPLDRNADGILDNPFEIDVTANGQIHNADGVVMTPVMSAIEVYFYSYYYPEGTSIPKSANYTVKEIYLVNAGKNGWYNPMEGIVYPNYNYRASLGNRTVYSSTVLMDSGNTTQNQLPLSANPSSVQFIDKKTGDQVTAMYETGSVPVFPSDYRGVDMGGNPYIMPMTIQVKLEDNITGLFNKASIPISFIIERNKLYKFYVNVTSEQIAVLYSVSNWEVGGDGSDADTYTDPYTELGGELKEYKIVEFDHSSGDWENGGGGSQEIKDVN